MYKFGLEREFFIKDDDGLIPASKTVLPQDEGGILVEARGEARDDIVEAVYSLKAACHRLMDRASEHGLVLIRKPVKTVDRTTFIDALRHGGSKGAVNWNNIYGHPHHAHGDNEYLAGLHISVTFPRTMRVGEERREYNAPWDYVQFIRHMDKEFESEIESVNRKPGFYEIKPRGRIEYRSLPANVSLGRVIDAVQEWS